MPQLSSVSEGCSPKCARMKYRWVQVLNLGHNRLASLEGIGGCRQLQALVANDNQITVHKGFLQKSIPVQIRLLTHYYY